ncbi:MAG TPA: hypothetical protein VJV78_11960 [Polyangiales bacterium]|nr:hypothetical protein [Polyangiales bacterium]
MLRIVSVVSCVFALACARTEAASEPHELEPTRSDSDAAVQRAAAGDGGGAAMNGRVALGGRQAPLPAGSGGAGDGAAVSGAGDGATASGAAPPECATEA